MESEIWLIVPKVRDRGDPAISRAIRRESERKGWEHRLVRPELHRDSAGKPIALLEPTLANNLYQRAHRARLAVFATVEVEVQLNPTRRRLDPKWLVRLSRLLRYKAFHRRIAGAALSPELLPEFEAWAAARHCESDRDPRVLPLHSFCPLTDCDRLHLAEGRARFERSFGPPLRRTGEQGLLWRPDPSHHAGREPQNVAGLALTPGFHWDLEGERRAQLLSLVDVWDVPRRRHANVYPNGFVRPGEGVRRVGSARS